MELLKLAGRWLFAGWMVVAVGGCKLEPVEDEPAAESGSCPTPPDSVGQGAIDGPECEARLAKVINSCDSRGEDGDGTCRDYPTNSGECLNGTWTQSQLCDQTEELGFCVQVISSIDEDSWWLRHFYSKPGTDDCEAAQKAAELCTISPARTW